MRTDNINEDYAYCRGVGCELRNYCKRYLHTLPMLICGGCLLSIERKLGDVLTLRRIIKIKTKINMTQKDLAEEYALKEYARANGDSDLIFEDNRCFTFDDIKAAFNAGRGSVVESLPELGWKGYAPFIHAATPIW